MRDPARINAVLEALSRYWHRHPNLRLGQLVFNLAYPGDVFFLEDGELLEKLQDAEREP